MVVGRPAPAGVSLGLKRLLVVAALAEAGMGVILLAYPPIVVRLLFAAEVAGAGIVMSRIAGIALIGLGVGCWPRTSAFQPLNGMATYSPLAMLYLAFLGVHGDFAGLLLWLAVVAHAILVVFLLRTRFKEQKTPGA